MRLKRVGSVILNVDDIGRQEAKLRRERLKENAKKVNQIDTILMKLERLEQHIFTLQEEINNLTEKMENMNNDLA